MFTIAKKIFSSCQVNVQIVVGSLLAGGIMLMHIPSDHGRLSRAIVTSLLVFTLFQLLHLIKVARKEAAQKNDEFKRIASVVPVIVWKISLNGEIVWANRRFVECVGEPPDGEYTATALAHPDDAATIHGSWIEAIHTHKDVKAEFRMLTKEGEYRWMSTELHPLIEGDKIICFLATASDIHDLKLAQQAAEDAVKVRNDFITAASHDLRQPLSTIRLSAQSIRKVVEQELSENEQRKFERLISSTLRMEGMIAKMLDVTTIAGGKLKIDPVEFDFTEIVEEIVDEMQDALTVNPCSLIVTFKGPIVGRWDKVRTQQIVTNLITNAIKYGEGKPIEVYVTGDDNTVTLRVKDRGIGISEYDRERIFEKFERAVDPDKYNGIGLGLWITRELTERMGGNISVESEPDVGTTFVVELPRDTRSTSSTGRLRATQVKESRTG